MKIIPIKVRDEWELEMRENREDNKRKELSITRKIHVCFVYAVHVVTEKRLQAVIL